MSNMVTRCPKCATSFRITSAQLQSAKGAVRCGSCLHIFKAQDYLVSGAPTDTPSASQPKAGKPVAPVTAKASPQTRPTTTTNKPAETTRREPAKPAAPTKTASAQPAPAHTKTPAAATPPANKTSAASKPTTAARPATQTQVPAKPSQPPAKPGEQKLAFDQAAINRELALSGDDDFLISDDMDEEPGKKETDYEFDGFLDIEQLPKQSSSLFDREIRNKEPEKDDVDPDESWAMELLDEADDEMRMTSTKKDTNDREDYELKVNAHDRLNAPATYDEDDSKGDEDERDSHVSSAPVSKVPFKGPVFNLVAEKSSSDNEGEEIHAHAYTDNHLYQQAMSDAKGEAPMRTYDTSRAALLMNIMPEPVEMTTRRDLRLSPKKMWTALSILMIVFLIVQVAWMQFDNLNRTEPYRSFYASVCTVFGCKLPTLVDRSKIRAYNLVVRNHPKTENALMVDAILLNNASFQQPFPDLTLAFSTMDGTPVAVRRFTPAEYLRGELAGRSLMPQNQPVHLTLELVDPGPDAVNYHAYIPE